MKKLLALIFAFAFGTTLHAQNPGTVTSHAFAIGKGPTVSGYTSLLCGSGQLPIGSATDPVCQTITGDGAISAAGVLTLATVNANVGTFGSATQCITTTQNAKGLTTAISAANCTPPIGNVTGLGTGVATALGLNVGTAGAPVINGGALGTPSSGVGTNLTGVPIGSGVSGLGTGVAAALGTAVGSAGSPVVNGGALGTPSSGVGTNLTALNASNLASGTVPIARQPVQPNFRVHLVGNQSISASTYTKVLYDTVDIDSNSFWSATNHNYLPTVAGTYQFCASAYVGATYSLGSLIIVQFSKNGLHGTGTEQGSGVTLTGGANTFEGVTAACTVATMNGSTDTMEIDIDTNGTTPVITGFTTASVIANYFTGTWISP
jgi:hypothetical protein